MSEKPIFVDSAQDDLHAELEDLREQLWDADGREYKKLKKRFDDLERQVYPDKFRVGDYDEAEKPADEKPAKKRKRKKKDTA